MSLFLVKAKIIHKQLIMSIKIFYSNRYYPYKQIYLCRSNFKSLINITMKKVLALLMIAGMFSVVACGPSAEEKTKMEEAAKMQADSIAAAAQQAADQAAAAAQQAATTVDSTVSAVVDSAAAMVK